MSISNVLSFLGGYFKSNEFDLDIAKVADIAEISEDELKIELKTLCDKGEISLDNSKITLINIKAKTNKIFNDTYAPVETMQWDKHVMLKLDK